LSATISRICGAGSRVNVCSGSPTFSARVIELQSAPAWNDTPSRRRKPSRASDGEPQKLSPS